MLKSYFKIAWRNLAKQKGLSIINIFGLSVGIACFSLFMLYAVNELNFDNFHKNAANIYRVYAWDEQVGENPGGARPWLPMPLGPSMKQDLPGIENDVRFLDNWGANFIKTDQGVWRDKISFADPCFFTVFSFPLKVGDRATALQDLRNIVLTESTAKRIFGGTDVIGKIIQVKTDDQFEPFTVSAIAYDPPSNSSLQFTMLANFNYHVQSKSGRHGFNNWNRNSYQTFVQLRPGSNLPASSQLLADFWKKYHPDDEKAARKDGWKGKGSPYWYGLQPLRGMHTDTKIDGDALDPKTIWILVSIAAGVLLIACINFTTLAIGRSAGRSKEVGVRKVVGGSQRSLVTQFLAEALMLTLLSAVIGLLIVNFLLPWFNSLSGRNLTFSFSQFPQLIWLTVGLVAVVALLAGSYPSFVLSRFRPVEVLKTKVKLGGSNLFTKALVTLQFVVSTGLIISTLVIMQQLHFLQSKTIGFNKENIVEIDARGIPNSNQLYPLFKTALASQPGIAGVTSSDMGLGEGMGSNQSGFKYKGKDKFVYEYFIDPDYLHVLGLQLLQGRNFDPGIRADTINSVIVNEAMMNDFGWTIKNAVGQQIKGYYENESNIRTPVVVGVVKNFNYLDLRQSVKPQMFQQFPFYKPQHFLVRLAAGDPAKPLAILQAEWKRIAPDYPFKFEFLDESLNRFYQSELRWSSIVGWAGGISIFLACLGLFGLVVLTAINRKKEIGIRKILGASFSALIGLLSKDFLKLVVIAFFIATAISWYLMNKWLQNYAYRIHISWLLFALTGLAIFCIALFTVGFQAAKAAFANPVKSLRVE